MKHPHHTPWEIGICEAFVPSISCMYLWYRSCFHSDFCSCLMRLPLPIPAFPQTTTINQPYFRDGGMLEAAAKCLRRGWRWCRCSRERRCHPKFRAHRCCGGRCLLCSGGCRQTILSLAVGHSGRGGNVIGAFGGAIGALGWWGQSRRQRNWSCAVRAEGCAIGAVGSAPTIGAAGGAVPA
jgi:hypothetical protein